MINKNKKEINSVPKKKPSSKKKESSKKPHQKKPSLETSGLLEKIEYLTQEIELLKEKRLTGIFLQDEFKQLKTYFRKGPRPSQILAITNFESHLEKI